MRSEHRLINSPVKRGGLPHKIYNKVVRAFTRNTSVTFQFNCDLITIIYSLSRHNTIQMVIFKQTTRTQGVINRKEWVYQLLAMYEDTVKYAFHCDQFIWKHTGSMNVALHNDSMKICRNFTGNSQGKRTLIQHILVTVYSTTSGN